MEPIRFSLPNGLKVVLQPGGAAKVVAFQAWVGVGSADEPPELAGIAHVFEHMLFKGTERRGVGQIAQEVEGAGGEINAWTSFDQTVYHLVMASRYFDTGLDILADAIQNSSFDAGELERELKVVIEEIKQGEDAPARMATQALFGNAFSKHPYRRPVSGTAESVRRITREQVAAFHRDNYRPDGAVISVVGDVTVDEIRRELMARLAGWSAPGHARPDIPMAPSSPPVEHRRITRALTQATVSLGRPAIRQDHPDYFPLVVANYILGGGSASRLYSRVREERGLAYSVYSFVSPARHGPAYFVGLQTRLDAVDEAVGLVKAEMARLGREPVTARELGLAKSYLIGSYPLRTDTSGKMAALLTAIEENQLGLDWPDRFKAGVAKVTAADVARVAAIYLDPAIFSSVVVGK